MRDRTEDQVILALIRHGETRANAERRYLGKTDESLSEQGVRTLLSYKARGYYPQADYLFASPMKRCMETADILYPKSRPGIIPEWEEMDFGLFEYKTYEQLKDDVRYQAWIDSGGMSGIPQGESRKDFTARCERGFFKMLEQLRHRARRDTIRPVRAGLILHGGTIMALLYTFGGREYFDCQASNGRGYLCRMDWPKEQRKESRIRIEVVGGI